MTYDELLAMVARGDTRILDAPAPPSPVVPPLASDVSEAVLLAKLQQLCTTTGHLLYHPYRSTRSTPGWPDCAIVHPEGGPLYLWELKRQDGQVSPAQRRWLEALAQVARIETAVMRPSDWNAMVRLLAHRRSRPCLP